MKQIGLIAGAAALLWGCTEVTQEVQRASWHARGMAYKSSEKFQEMLSYTPKRNIKQAPQTAFCYHSSSDIICYDEPKPYISNTLAGYQGYTAPAVPTTIQYAPENAALTGGPGAPKAVSNLTETMAPMEPVEVVGEKEIESAPGNPDTLIPRF